MRGVVPPFLVAGAAALCLVTAATPDPAGAAQRLGARTFRERQQAEAELAALGAAAIPVLERAARDPADLEVRTRARRLLARLAGGDPAADESARRRAEATALLRPLPAAREFAAGSALDGALAALWPESSEALAAAVLSDGGRTLLDEHVATALARRPVPASIEALARAWAADGLAPSAAHRAAAMLGVAVEAEPALRDAGVAAAALLVEQGGRIEAPRRRTRVALVAACAGAGAAEFLVAAASDPDPGVRTEAVRALGRHLPAAAAATLRGAAADCDPGVRVAALEALRGVPGIPTPEPAVAAASADEAPVRRAAAELLARDATPAELPVLAALAADSSPSVRYAARAALRALSR